MQSGGIAEGVLAVLIVLASATQFGAPSGAFPAAPESQAAAATGQEERSREDPAAADLRAIKIPALPVFHPQQPKRIQFANGMVVFLQEDHELPLIEAGITIRGGAANEPADKAGLASIYGSVWRTGGTKTRTGDELDDLLEARAARLETTGSMLSTSIFLSCMKNDFELVLELADDLLHNPEFRQEKLDLARNVMRAGIARRNDNQMQIATREATRIGYGAQSPYARIPQYATVAGITREDLLDWHKRYVHPNNMIISVTGDFDSAEMESKLHKTFAAWPRGPSVQRTGPSVVPPPRPGVYFAAKGDVNQSEVRLIGPGIRRDNVDYYAVWVMNEILGGSPSSRLFSDLRTKAGLAYAVSGWIGATLDHPGLAIFSIGTRSGTTAKAIRGLYAELEDMRSRRVTQYELDHAKQVIMNSFIFEYDSRAKVANARVNCEFNGYPADLLEQFQKGVQKVSIDDVNRAARKYLDKSKYALLVVGKAADFDAPLSSFGSVTMLDIGLVP